MRRVLLWLVLLTSSVVTIGVFLQAFSIAAYVRGAGDGALDMHETLGFLTHLIEVVVFLAAIGAWWKQWRSVALAFSLPVIGTLQLFLVGDTDEEGGWVNGLHGLLALVVLILAAAIAHRAMRDLGLRRPPQAPDR